MIFAIFVGTLLAAAIDYFLGAELWYWLMVESGPFFDESRRVRALVGMGVEVACVLPGVIVAVLIVHRRQKPPGHCRGCGYNLTGNTSGVCPECGERV